ncbi:cytochrome P450 [Viridothelium virens]|uniref:Cytochrome P450 n=1 Tax=Viridothelium virens TaxID=1048519 RepID=A0A6A6HIV3_VIRVR|nr:cytochrome P450 [Viridothelium virens]
MLFNVPAAFESFTSHLYSSWFYLIIIAILTPLLYTLSYDLLRVLLMPPGPLPIPFVGNTSMLPKTSPWLTFQHWSQVYGPMFTIWQGRRATVVVSDPQITFDLLEKRSAKFSSRPRTVAMGELLWEMGSILVQPYGKEWSIRRKLLHAALTPKALRLYKPTQEAEANRLCMQLLRLSEEPSGRTGWDWDRLFERFTASIVFCVAYGHRIDSLNAKIIRQRFEFMHFSALLNVPGAYLVESFPLLKYVPECLAPWKAEIKRNGRREAKANMELVDLVRKDMRRAKEKGEDQIPDSLTKMLLEMKEKEDVPLSDRNFAFVPASLFGAGSDTTASSMCSAVLALVTHPATLKQAQKELDATIGKERSPTFADEPNLPYLRALVKEVLRWRPVAVLGGTPHASTGNDWYLGKWIPKGTTILGNNWAINLNEEYYPEPHLFEPRRFLALEMNKLSKFEAAPGYLPVTDGTAGFTITPPELTGKAHPSPKGHSSFGWGRRICPGADLASNTLFIVLAKLIWAFDFLPADGRKPEDYDIFAYTQGFNIRPQRFECKIRLRDGDRKVVLNRDLQDAEAWLERFSAFGEQAG